MLDGWYCRAKAEEAAEAAAENGQSHSDYRTKFRELKKKLKYLVHENEYFKEALKVQQQKLLKVSRDRSYLLDRLTKYEKPDDLSDPSDSADEQPKRKKQEQPAGPKQPGQKRRRSSKAKPLANMSESAQMFPMHQGMTAEEIQRHLAQREFQTLHMTADVPNEMFSSESNDNESPPNSHSNIEEECVSMDNMIIHHEINLPYCQD